MINKLAVPISREPNLREGPFLTSLALPDGIEVFRSLRSPLRDFIPKFLPALIPIASLAMRVTVIEAVVDHLR
jgi:hypothetical protein